MPRSRIHLVPVILLIALVGGLAACGGDDEASSAEPVTVTVEETTAATTSASETSVPVALIGTYEGERKGSDFPPGLWKLAIGPHGELFIDPPDGTGFFNSPVTAENGTLVIPPHYESGCTSSGEYAYTVKGDGPGGSLTLEVKDDPCGTRGSLLAASWQMTD